MAEEPTRSAWSYPETSATLLRTLREARSSVEALIAAVFRQYEH